MPHADVQELVIPSQYIYVVLVDNQTVYVGCSEEPERIGTTLIDLRKKLGCQLHDRVSIRIIDFTRVPTVDTGGRGSPLTNLEQLLIALHGWHTGSLRCNGVQNDRGTKKGGWISNESALKTVRGIYDDLGLPSTHEKNKALDSLKWEEVTKDHGPARGLVVYSEVSEPGSKDVIGLRFAHCTYNTSRTAPHLTGNNPAVVCKLTCEPEPTVEYLERV